MAVMEEMDLDRPRCPRGERLDADRRVAIPCLGMFLYGEGIVLFGEETYIE